MAAVTQRGAIFVEGKAREGREMAAARAQSGVSGGAKARAPFWLRAWRPKGAEWLLRMRGAGREKSAKARAPFWLRA